MKQIGRLLVVLVGLGLFRLGAHAPVRAQSPETPIAMTKVVVKARAGDLPVEALAGGVARSSPELAKLGLSIILVANDEVPARLAALRSEPAVAFAVVAQPVHALDVVPDDAEWPRQYGPVAIQAPQAWELTTGTASVTIAIVDTGIDLGHPDLADKIVAGTNVISPTQTPQDDNGHGTHVAGIAAAASGNATGIAGISWGARLMPVKALDANGDGDDALVAAGIVWAVDHGADIVNLSLGGSCPSPALELAATYASSKGATLVAAAGNTGTVGVLCPAAFEPVIAVAATGPDDVRASFSSLGPEIDVAAPGVGIYSTLWTSQGSGYGYKSGTSMAAPHVAGLVALLASLPQFDTPEKIRAALEDTALELGPACRDSQYGAGLVQASAALHYELPAVRPPDCYFLRIPLVWR
jgi:subtilisin family serine protease